MAPKKKPERLGRVTVKIQVEGPRPPIEVTLDPSAMAFYIRVRRGKVARTIEVEEGVQADFARSGKLLGIEFLKPAKVELLDQIAEEYAAPEVKALRAVSDLAEMLVPA